MVTSEQHAALVSIAQAAVSKQAGCTVPCPAWPGQEFGETAEIHVTPDGSISAVVTMAEKVKASTGEDVWVKKAEVMKRFVIPTTVKGAVVKGQNGEPDSTEPDSIEHVLADDRSAVQWAALAASIPALQDAIGH